MFFYKIIPQTLELNFFPLQIPEAHIRRKFYKVGIKMSVMAHRGTLRRISDFFLIVSCGCTHNTALISTAKSQYTPFSVFRATSGCSILKHIWSILGFKTLMLEKSYDVKSFIYKMLLFSCAVSWINYVSQGVIQCSEGGNAIHHSWGAIPSTELIWM